jgi:hypothetical protein
LWKNNIIPNMQKPSDYSVYFNEDGTRREDPFYDKEGNLIDGDKSLEWNIRAAEIEFSLLPMEEQEKQQEKFRAMVHMARKMNS